MHGCEDVLPNNWCHRIITLLAIALLAHLNYCSLLFLESDVSDIPWFQTPIYGKKFVTLDYVYTLTCQNFLA